MHPHRDGIVARARAGAHHRAVMPGVFSPEGAVTIVRWDHAPAWYHVLALALVMPYAWLGGRLRERQLARSGYHPRTPAAAA